ncbi:MAG: NAD(P)/FAD-dependent oxidoreductase [Rhodopirellula sp. JB053]
MTGQYDGQSVVIVGAGTIGIACAHYLSKMGLKVTVIDRGKLAAACSHGNCGYICPSHVPPLTEPGAFSVAFKSLFNPQAPFRVKPRISPAMWNWMWQFAKRCNHQQVLTVGKHLQAILDASMDEYREIMKEHAFDSEWAENGLLYVLRTQRAMDAFAKSDEMLTEEFGVSATRIEGDQLPSFDPGLKPGLAGAFHYTGDASVRPDRLNQQWVELLRGSGVQFLEDCELSSVEKEGGRIRALVTTEEKLEADHFVFAMGAWSTRWSQELQCRIPIEPGKGYSLTMARADSQPKYPMLFPEHKVGVSPFEDGWRLGSMMEFAGYDETIGDSRIQQLRDSARPYLVASVDGEAEEKWFGWRPMTWDSLPIIGRTKNLHNAFLATGHNMLGLSLAPSTGRLIAELVTGNQTHIDATPYSPSRF